MYILWCLSRIFHRCLSGSFELWCHFLKKNSNLVIIGFYNERRQFQVLYILIYQKYSLYFIYKKLSLKWLDVLNSPFKCLIYTITFLWLQNSSIHFLWNSCVYIIFTPSSPLSKFFHVPLPFQIHCLLFYNYRCFYVPI